MYMVNIREARTHFSQLVQRVAAGEEIVIAKAGKPTAKLVPYRTNTEARQPGLWRGKVKIADDFDVLPKDLDAAFQPKSGS